MGKGKDFRKLLNHTFFIEVMRDNIFLLQLTQNSAQMSEH